MSARRKEDRFSFAAAVNVKTTRCQLARAHALTMVQAMGYKYFCSCPVASWPLPYIFASAEAAHTIDMPSQCPAKHGCTFAPRSDGFGSMYGGVLVAFAWCVAQNRTFCVPDLQDRTFHGADILDVWKAVGGPWLGPPAPSGMHLLESREDCVKEKRTCHRTERIYDGCNCPSDPACDFGHACGAGYAANPASVRFVREAAQASYRQAEKIRSGSERTNPAAVVHSRPLQIAVHIRRDDVTHYYNKEKPTKKPTGNDTATAMCLNRLYGNHHNAAIHVFSDEKDPDSFGTLLRTLTPEAHAAIRFHLSESLPISLRHMIAADVFVMAKSTLSWTAAFISAGRVYQPTADMSPTELAEYEHYWNNWTPTLPLQLVREVGRC